jgi:hypothetical protein
MLEGVQRQQLSEQNFHLLERLLRLLLGVARLLAQKQTSLSRLKRLLFGPPLDPPSSPPPGLPRQRRPRPGANPAAREQAARAWPPEQC